MKAFKLLTGFVLLIVIISVIAVVVIFLIEEADEETKRLRAQQTAQNADIEQTQIVLTVALPVQTTDPEQFFTEFEDTHPGVDVIGSTQLPGPASISASTDIQQYLRTLESYIQTADVVYMYQFSWAAEATRAGYFYDLRPLVDADETVNEDAYYQPAWHAFDWDNGLWAVPIGSNINGILYDTHLFDEAGVAYPSEEWTADEFFRIIRSFAQRDDSRPVLSTGRQDALILRSLLNRNYYVYDNNGMTQPELMSPEVASIFTQWIQMKRDGLIVDDPPLDAASGGFGAIPLRFTEGPTFEDTETTEIATLPGRVVGLHTDSFALNRGTHHPELAYELARYLSQHELIAQTYLFPGVAIPAYRPLDELLNAVGIERDPRIDQLAGNVLTLSETLYASYITDAVTTAALSEDLSAEDVLFNIQTLADQNKELAQQIRSNLIVSVPTLAPTLLPGKVEIVFGGLEEFLDPAHPQVTALINEFVQQDPQVGNIRLVSYFPEPLSEQIEELDCFYTADEVVGVPPYQEHLLPLDSLADADTTFDRGDIAPGVLEMLTHSDRLYSYPIGISPYIISFDRNTVLNNGALEPSIYWSYSEMLSTFENINGHLEEGQYVLMPKHINTHYITLLAAAAGGLLYDYTSQPPVPQFTEPQTIDALSDVLNRIRQNQIAYTEIRLGGNRLPLQDGILHLQTLFDFKIEAYFAQQVDTDEVLVDDAFVMLPAGSSYTPSSYQVGAGYINHSTPHIDGCYRWLRFIADHAYFAPIIPAKINIASSPIVETVQGAAIADFYGEYLETLSDLNTVIIPAPLTQNKPSLGAEDVEEYWLGQAFNSYVLEDSDLATNLAIAQDKVLEFRICLENNDLAVSVQQVGECAVQVDPGLQ
jgi:ABC-type glycerol-3-phosphate transport system substrate-binding protein